VLAAVLTGCFASTGREEDNAADLQTVEIDSLSRQAARHTAPEEDGPDDSNIPDVAMKIDGQGLVVGAWKGGDRNTDRLAIACYEEVLRVVGRPAPSENPPICRYVKFKRYLVR